MTIGIVGMGQMGAAVAARLIAREQRVVSALEGRSAVSRRRAEAAGVVDVGTLDELVRDAEIIFSIMGSDAALSFAADLEASLARSVDSKPIFVDCNLLAPTAMVAISDSLGQLGISVVDAGIVGPPPTSERAPQIYVAGPDAGRVGAFLESHGFTVTCIGAEIGAASALKVYSAAVWQGCLALMMEVMAAAQRSGVGEQLAHDLELHQSLLHDWFLPAALDAPPRARRWAADMGAIAETMESEGASGAYHGAAAGLYLRLAALPPCEWTSAQQIAQAIGAGT